MEISVYGYSEQVRENRICSCTGTGYNFILMFFERGQAEGPHPLTHSADVHMGQAEARNKKLNQVFPPWVAGTQLFEPLLLPRRNYISKNLDLGVKAKCQTQALKCGVPVS